MIFFSNNLCYIKFFSEMYYHVFSTKADQKGGSIHKEKNLSTEIHILVFCLFKLFMEKTVLLFNAVRFNN